LCGEIGAWQKDLADGDQLVIVGLMPRAAHLIVKEGHRDLHMDARAIAGLAIRVHRAAMPDCLQRIDAAFDDLAAGLAVDADHQPDAAGRMFILGTVEGVFRHPVAAGLFLLFPARHVTVLHVRASFKSCLRMSAPSPPTICRSQSYSGVVEPKPGCPGNAKVTGLSLVC